MKGCFERLRLRRFGFEEVGVREDSPTGLEEQLTSWIPFGLKKSIVGKEVSDQHYIVLTLWSSISSTYKSSNDKPADDEPKDDIGSKIVEELVNKEDQAYRDELDRLISQEKEASDAAEALRKEFEQGCIDQKGVTQAGSTNSYNTVSNPINAASTLGTLSTGGPSSPHPDAFIPANTLLHVNQDDSQIPDLEETAKLQCIGIFNSAYDDDLDIYTSLVQCVDAEADFNNMESSTIVSLIPTHKVHIDHPKDQILGDPKSTVQTRRMAKKSSGAHALMEPKKVSQSFDYESWVEAMQEELRQVTLKLSNLHAVKRIFRYLKGQPKLGLWYPRDSPFDLEAYSDTDNAGANLDRKSTTGDCQFLSRRLISWQCKKQTIVATSTTEAEYVVVTNCYGQTQVLRNHIWGAYAHARFETASKMSSDPPLSTGHTVRSEEDRMEQETYLMDFVPPTPYDLPLTGGHTHRSDEGRTNLLELMSICTKLSNRVLALKEAKTTQAKVITRLKLSVRRLDKKRKATTSGPMKRRLSEGRVETSTNKSLGEDASKQGRNDDQTEELNLTNGVDTEVIIEEKGNGEKGGSTIDQVSTTRPKVSVATPSTTPTTTTIFGDEDLTIAQTFIKTRSEKAKEKGVAFRDVEELPRLTKSTTMTHEEQEMFTIKARARLLTEYFERGKKQLATERAEAIRNKPPTRTQVRNMMITYLKHMDDFVPMDSEKEEKKSVKPDSKDKKGKRIKSVPDLAPKQKSSMKQKMMQELESAKSDEEESIDHEQENKELRMWLTIVLDKEETIDLEILSTKYPIVDWKSQILGNVDMEDKHVYKIIRAYGYTSYHKLRMWLTIVLDKEETIDLEILSTKYPIVDWKSQILGNVDMEDKHVYKIIRAYGYTSYHKSLSSMLRKFNRQDSGFAQISDEKDLNTIL
nr:uncharacterized mitochondrial protein AtMg00810-like [Tanacetum cinerariifolium]